MSNSELFDDRVINLGVCGVSTAYRSARLVERICNLGAEVRVILNKGAEKFVTPLTFERISGHKVVAGSPNFPGGDDESDNRLPLRESELTVIAPASFNFIGRLATGLGQDFLTKLSSTSDNPVLLVPSMRTDLYSSQTAQSQLTKLRDRGFYTVEPTARDPKTQVSEDFPLAPDLDRVISKARDIFQEDQLFRGKKILVTSPPTRDPFSLPDHPRYESRQSLGYRISNKAKQMGGEVLLASGPTDQIPPSGVGVVWIKTANELDELLTAEAPGQDLILMVGSASEWGYGGGSDILRGEKTKRFDLDIPETPDLGRKLGNLKPEGQVLVEFITGPEKVPPSIDRVAEHNIDAVFYHPATPDRQNSDSGLTSGSLLFPSGNEKTLQGRDEARLSRLILKELGEEYFS